MAKEYETKGHNHAMLLAVYWLLVTKSTVENCMNIVE